MSDLRIQTGPAAANADPIVDQLLRRVQTLEADKRRWKATALVCLLLLLLAVIGGGLGTLGVGSVYLSYMQRVERQEMAIREAEMARQQAEMAAQPLEAQRAGERANRNFEQAK